MLLVLGVTMAATPVIGRLLAGRPAPSWRRYYARWLLPLYALWVPVVLLNEIVVDPRRGTRALLESLILFRDVGERPVTGSGHRPAADDAGDDRRAAPARRPSGAAVA